MDEVFTCKICGKTCKTQKRLRKHHQNTHGEPVSNAAAQANSAAAMKMQQKKVVA